MHDPLVSALMAAGEAARRAMVLGHCCMASSGCAFPPRACAQSIARSAVAEFLQAKLDTITRIRAEARHV
ncbi:hypothetical protein KPL78_19220 [Roseomonas sp. HJA6]|uniref:Uncharacterized protein n=1 Tax=Roseomonas alba TaxID=2846776 RepID=A0ABS7ACI0_9PROT|nr:hypothetical protein [Neoroseomonas alba]MBW6400000.1 hypothetical protein [Neoroseomonas alba]